MMRYKWPVGNLFCQSNLNLAHHFMRNVVSTSLRLLQQTCFIFVVAALISQRFLHLEEFIDDPFSWIQSDRACHALNFYRDGINFLRPETCFLGNYKLLVLNFPLTEIIVALGYHLLGGPNLVYARLVTFAFYLGSAFYLYAIVNYLCGLRLARLTLLVYLILPLGLFYSRVAVHIDFPTIFFSHAMLYYLLRGYDEEKTGLAILGSLLGTFAFLIKAPYAFYLMIPFGFHVITNPKIKLLVKWTPLFAIIIIPFLLWRSYAETTNQLAPGWFFIPGYFKFINLGWWFYGPLSLRFDLNNWLLLGKRFSVEVTSQLGGYLFLLGLFTRSKVHSITFFRLWLIGSFIYLLIFFNLNVVHDYYQIPFLAISSFFIAVSLDSIFLNRSQFSLYEKLPFIITVFLLVANCLWVAENTYYFIDWTRVSAGDLIRRYTPEPSLLIASTSLYTDPRDPRLLYEAQRNGWSIQMKDLKPPLVKALIDEGAEYLAIVTDQTISINKIPLKSLPQKRFILNGGWQLYLFALNGVDFSKIMADQSDPNQTLVSSKDWSFSDIQIIGTNTLSLTLQVTGKDPIFRSPALNLKAADYNYITIIAVIPPPVECPILTLYFTTSNTPTESESRAIYLPFKPSREPLNFVINTHANPEWRGIISGLRIDPVCGLNSNGSAIKFKIESVALEQ